MRLLVNFVVLCLSLAVGIVTIEFLVRLTFPHFDPSGHVAFRVNADGVPLADKRGSFRQIKNTGDYNVEVTINQNGLREEKSLKSSKAKDIFVVGDSFSFGWGVEENQRFSNQLELLLPQTKVFNISIPTDLGGYAKLLSYAKKNGAIIKNLIISVTMENDIRIYNEQSDDAFTKNKKPKSKIEFSRVKYILRDHSAAYFMLTSVIQKNDLLREFGIKLNLIVPNLAILSNSRFDKVALTSSFQKLTEIVHEYKTTVVLIPSRGLWVGSDNEKLIAKKSHEFFVSLLKKNNISYLDVRKFMEQSGNPMSYHFKHDGHWIPSAHQMVAKQLAQKIHFMVSKK